MSSSKLVKNYHFLSKNGNYNLNFRKFQNKIEMEIFQLNKKIEDLNRKIDEQHIENILSDEILLLNLRKCSMQKCK